MGHGEGCCCPHHQAVAQRVDLVWWWPPALACAALAYQLWPSIVVVAVVALAAVPAGLLARVAVGEIRLRRLYDRAESAAELPPSRPELARPRPLAIGAPPVRADPLIITVQPRGLATERRRPQ